MNHPNDPKKIQKDPSYARNQETNHKSHRLIKLKDCLKIVSKKLTKYKV